jgi:glycosyltransferase involved in cell wall biosynthesis
LAAEALVLRVQVDGVIYQIEAVGGVSRHFNELLPRMCTFEPELHVRVFVDGPLQQQPPRHERIQLIHSQSTNPVRTKSGFRRMFLPVSRMGARLLEGWKGSGRDEIWHSTYYTLPKNWQGKQVATLHDAVHELYPDLYDTPFDDHLRLQKRQSIEAADAVICVSETTRQEASGYYGVEPERLVVIHNACSPIFRRIEMDISKSGEPFILYVGSRSPIKNFDRLLEAYAAWHLRSEVSLVVAGRGWTVQERERLRRLKIQKKVRLEEDVDDENLCRLYNQAAVFVYTSLYEGFGIPLLEAMACGCPVAASRIPSTLEVAGDYPFYFDSHEPGDLLSASEQALSAGRDDCLTKAGIARAAEFSWDKTAMKTLEVYRSLL